MLNLIDAERAWPAVTLVIPAHNEQHRLPATVRAYRRALAGTFGDSVELIVVANGCTDATVEVARSLTPEVPGLRVLDIREPVHKGGAVLAGFRAARGSWIAFADADGATSPASLVRLVGRLDAADVVIGTRHAEDSVIPRRQPLRRRVLSRLFNVAARTLFGLPFRDTQCGAKAFHADAARRLATTVRERAWAFDLDLILVARRIGYRIVEEPVTWSDVDGSQLRAGSIALDVMRSLARLWLRELGSRLPWTRADQVADGTAPATGRRARVSRILALNWRDPHHPDAGGAELNLFEQARRWVRAGYDVTVVSARRGGSTVLPPSADIDGVKVRRMGGRFSVYLFAGWYLLMYGHQFDRILDVANGIPFFVPLFTRRPVALLVHHVHARQWFAEFGRSIGAIGWFLERFVVPRVYRDRPTIAVSPTTREALLATGFRGDRVHVVYNGVTANELHGVERRPNVIAYVGRIKRYKRLDLLVRALPAIREAVPDARLIVAGEGDAQPELEALVAELGLGDAVRFLGFVDDATKDRLLAAATVFATPSMHEGWGLSVIEANHQGTPAVAYDVPGLRVAIRHGQTGLLARTDDEFRQALVAILTDPALRSRLAEGARAWASRFDWDTTARHTLSILQAPDAPAPVAADGPSPASGAIPFDHDADVRVATR